MNTLVTGGAGFIGSHLVEALLRRGGSVTVLDDLSTGSRTNLSPVHDDPRLRFIEGSVLHRDLVAGLVKAADAVYHLASAVGVRLVVQQPVRTIRSIVEGTDAVLGAAREHGKRVLVTSSSEVYGKGVRVPFSEQDDVVLGPTTARRWVYACSKMLDEFLALAHWQEAGLPVVCVRLFNTVGPRQSGRYGMVLPRFIRQALAGEPLTVYGTGAQTRCFAFVEDVVGALVDLLDCPEAAGRVVNVGNDQEISILDLAENIRQQCESSSPIVHIPYEQAYMAGFEDLGRRVPDLGLVQSLIGYWPKYDLDATIRSTIGYWRQRSPETREALGDRCP